MSDRLKDKVAPVSDAGSSGPGWLNSKARAVPFAREGAKVLKLTSTAMWPRDQAGWRLRAVVGNASRADDVAVIVDI